MRHAAVVVGECRSSIHVEGATGTQLGEWTLVHNKENQTKPGEVDAAQRSCPNDLSQYTHQCYPLMMPRYHMQGMSLHSK